MGFYGLNLISCLIILLIAWSLFGPRYLGIILNNLYLSWHKCIKIFLLTLSNKKSNDNKTESETDTISG